MNADLQAALEVIVRIDDVDEVFNREAVEGDYRSEGFETALGVIRRHLPRRKPD